MRARTIWLTMILVALFVGAPATTSSAATATAVAAGQMTDAMVVDVPFDFVAGDKMLPAGRYRVELLPKDTEPEVLVSLQTAASADSDRMVFQTVPIQKVSIKEAGMMDGRQPQLVFSRVGDRYYLEEVRAR